MSAFVRFACPLAMAIWLSVGICTVAQSQSAGDRLPVWMLDGVDNRLYLLGSVHMLRESDHPLPAEIYDAYSDSDALVMELDISSPDPIATQKLINELGMIRDGKQLGDLLGASDFSEAQRLAERIDIPLAMLAAAEPWFAAITIDAMMLMRIGFSPAYGIESHFAERAAADSKPISALETERQQLEMLDRLSPQAQRDLLLETLNEGEDFDLSMNELILAWRGGDTDWLDRELLQKVRRYPEIYTTLVVQRNEDWAGKIVELLDDPQNYLIIVGTMHMIGEDGLPALLRKRGLDIQQLRQN
jgi:uncharacterized protein YbaP (TraB family)